MAKKRKNAGHLVDPTDNPGKLPDGITLEQRLHSPDRGFTCLAWSPDGQSLATGTETGRVMLWTPFQGKMQLESTWATGLNGIQAIAWSPDGNRLLVGGLHSHAILIDKYQGKPIGHFESTSSRFVHGLAWAPDNSAIAVGGGSPTLHLIDVHTGRFRRTLDGHSGQIGRLAWQADGRLLASASGDQTAAIWDVSSGKMLHRLSGHSEAVPGVAWLPDGKRVITAGFDSSLRVWNAESGDQTAVLEGHTGRVWCVSVAGDGNMLASDGDEGIRIWRIDRFETVAAVHHGIMSAHFQSLEFHPTQPILAAITDGGQSISLWRLAVPTLLRAPKPVDAVRYANAKVVLVGDTGVGKSGLAIRLVHDRFEPTVSTHGRRALTLETETVDDPVAPGRPIARETLLWDLAGQPGYRLVHQLSLDDAAVALVLFDARSETDPFGGAAYWSKALDQARSNVPIKKFLVAARVDRGGVGVSRERIDRFLQEHGFDGFYRTSALTGEGRDELLDAIRREVSWDRLPIVSSNWLLTGLRQFFAKRRADRSQPLLLSADELWKQAQSAGAFETVSDPDGNLTFDQFAACLRRLHEADVIELLTYQATEQNPAADADVLLEPTFVDAYASAVIVAARDEPDGLGHVRETEILEGRFPLDAAERLEDRDPERKVLVAVIERFLDREIAIRERIEGADYLVFPSQYTRESPFPGSSSYGIRYDFAGPLLSIFATLAVRLAHHAGFRNRQFYRNAAAYEPVDGGRCVILFEDLEEGRGRLSVFFEEGVSGEGQAMFLQYVYEHLLRKAVPGSIVRRRAYHCPQCGYLFDDQVVERRLERGDDEIVCSNCDARSPLYDLLLDSGERQREAIRDVDADARAAMHRQLAVTAIQGKKRSGAFDLYLAYAPEDRDEARWLAELFQALGLRPWLDVWQTVPGQTWQQTLHPSLLRIRAVLIALGPTDEPPWLNDSQAKTVAAFNDKKARFATVRLPQSGLVESVREASVQEVSANAIAAAPKFLRDQTPFDLRWIDEDDIEPLEECLRQLLGRYSRDFGMSEPVRDALRRKRQDEQRRRQFADAHPDSATLIRFHPKLKPQQFGSNGAELLRCQIAEVIGMPSQSVTVHNAQAGPPRVTLRFDLPEDVERLFAMGSTDDPFMREVLDRWAIDRTEFRNLNQDALGRVKKTLASRTGGAGIAVLAVGSRAAGASGPRPAFQILSVELKNFRCFRELSLDFDRPSTLGGYWTCLAGINGSGKSSILQAICIGLLNQSAVHELGGGLLDRLRRLEDGRRQDLEVTIRCRDREGNEFDEWINIQQAGVRSGRRARRVRNPQTVNRPLLILSYGATRNLSEAMDTRHADKSDEAQRQMTLFDPLARISSAESLLATTDKDADFVCMFTRLCGEIFGGHFRVMMRDGGVRFCVEDEALDAIDLPDGFRSSVAWIADLCQAWCRRYPERAREASPADIEAIVLIDEIDLHLHMSLQRRLVPALRKALPRVQWIVSTHSPLILTSFDRHEIVALDRSEPTGRRDLDRQILGWTTDEVINWLMETPATSLVMEEKLRDAEQRGGDQTDVAVLLETSAEIDEGDARRRVAAMNSRLEKYKP